MKEESKDLDIQILYRILIWKTATSNTGKKRRRTLENGDMWLMIESVTFVTRGAEYWGSGTRGLLHSLIS